MSGLGANSSGSMRVTNCGELCAFLLAVVCECLKLSNQTRVVCRWTFEKFRLRTRCLN